MELGNCSQQLDTGLSLKVESFHFFRHLAASGILNGKLFLYHLGLWYVMAQVFLTQLVYELHQMASHRFAFCTVQFVILYLMAKNSGSNAGQMSFSFML